MTPDAPTAGRQDAGSGQAEPPYRTVLDAVGAVAAPVSIVTALAYYIGVQRQTALAGALGLDVSVLGLSTRDYVLRSTDTLVRFLAVLFVALMITTTLVAVVRRELGSRSATTRQLAARVSLGLGGVLVVYALVGLFRGGPLDHLSLLAPVALIAGGALSSVGLLALQTRATGSGGRGGGRGRAPLVVAGVGLGLIGLFWAANDYAHLQGRQRGLDLQASVGLLPQVTIYTRSALHTTSDQVAEQVMTAPDGERMYRYEGFRLLLHSAGRYLLLPVEPVRRQPVTVLPEEEIGWIEFTP